MNYPTQTIGDTTLVDSRVISTRPCKVIDIMGMNNGAFCYVMIFELAAVPANGTAARFVFPAQANFGWSMGESVDLAACCVAYSSTVATLTITADTRGTIQGLIKQ